MNSTDSDSLSSHVFCSLTTDDVEALQLVRHCQLLESTFNANSFNTNLTSKLLAMVLFLANVYIWIRHSQNLDVTLCGPCIYYGCSANVPKWGHRGSSFENFLATIPPDPLVLHTCLQVSLYACHTDIFGEVDVADDSGSTWISITQLSPPGTKDVSNRRATRATAAENLAVL